MQQQAGREVTLDHQPKTSTHCFITHLIKPATQINSSAGLADYFSTNLPNEDAAAAATLLEVDKTANNFISQQQEQASRQHLQKHINAMHGTSSTSASPTANLHQVSS